MHLGPRVDSVTTDQRLDGLRGLLEKLSHGVPLHEGFRVNCSDERKHLLDKFTVYHCNNNMKCAYGRQLSRRFVSFRFVSFLFVVSPFFGAVLTILFWSWISRGTQD